MKKILLTIFLFILVSSKNKVIEFGKNTTFDKDNKEFEFTYDQPDIFFIQTNYNHKLGLKFFIDGTQHYQYISDKGGVGFITSQHNAASYKIILETDLNDNGTIWVNPSKNELKLDMIEKVEWKFNITNDNYGPESKLTYVIDRVAKSKTIDFKYSNEIKDRYNKTIKVPSPFQVCSEGNCKDNISTYDFKKGYSYKIYIKYNKIGNYYVFPSFSLGDKKKLIFNSRVIYLLLLFIL